MNKNHLLLLIIFVLFAIGIGITACSVPPQVPQAEEIVCDAPYIRLGAGCCLDLNNNKICDVDESVAPAKESEPSAVVPEPVAQKSCDDYVLENVCTLTDAIVYTIKIGDAAIDSFNVEIIHNDPTQNTTSRSVRRSAVTEMNVAGGKANARVKGQLRLDPYIFSEAIFTSVPCGLEKRSGPGFPESLPSC